MVNNSGKPRFGTSDIAMIAVTVLWGLGTVVIKNVLGDFPGRLNVFVYNGIRLPIGAAMLLTIAKISGRKIGLQRQHMPYFFLVAFIGAVNSIAFLFGIKLTSSSNTGVIMGTVPLFILLFAFLMRIEIPTNKLVAGIVIGFSGSFVLAYKGGSISFATGDYFIIFGCMLLGLFTVLSRKLLDHYSAMVTSAWMFILITLYQIPFFLYYLPGQEWREISSVTWMYFAISIIGPLFIANTLYYYSIREIGPSRVGAYTFLTPAFTLIFAYFIRNELIMIQHIVGLAIIIIGVSITRIGKSRIQNV